MPLSLARCVINEISMRHAVVTSEGLGLCVNHLPKWGRNEAAAGCRSRWSQVQRRDDCDAELHKFDISAPDGVNVNHISYRAWVVSFQVA